MAQRCRKFQSSGFVVVSHKLKDRLYSAIHLCVIKDLCCNVVLGRDFQHHHPKVIFKYGSNLPELMRNMRTCYILEIANMEELMLFPNITSNFKLIPTKSRYFFFD